MAYATRTSVPRPATEPPHSAEGKCVFDRRSGRSFQPARVDQFSTGLDSIPVTSLPRLGLERNHSACERSMRHEPPGDMIRWSTPARGGSRKAGARGRRAGHAAIANRSGLAWGSPRCEAAHVDSLERPLEPAVGLTSAFVGLRARHPPPRVCWPLLSRSPQCLVAVGVTSGDERRRRRGPYFALLHPRAVLRDVARFG
jgi:hypothetical protein